MRAGLWAGARGAVVGGLLGALVALPIAFFIFEDVSVWVRLAVLGFTGFLAGATIGFSLAGGWSDDDADNGLGIEDQRREEAAGYDGNPRSGGESGAGGSSPRSSGTR